MLDRWTKRFPWLRFQIEEAAFQQAGRESPARMIVKVPEIKEKKLGDVLRDMLASIQCAYEIIGETIAILPIPGGQPPAPPEQ